MEKMKSALSRQLEMLQTVVEEDLHDNRDELEEEWGEAVEKHLELLESLRRDVRGIFRALELAYDLAIDMDDRGEFDWIDEWTGYPDETSEKGTEFLAIVSDLRKREVYKEDS